MILLFYHATIVGHQINSQYWVWLCVCVFFKELLIQQGKLHGSQSMLNWNGWVHILPSARIKLTVLGLGVL